MENDEHESSVPLGQKIVAIIGADAVLSMDLREMLGEAGFGMEEYSNAAAVPDAIPAWSSAIIDIGQAAGSVCDALARLSHARVPYVVLSCVDEDLPGWAHGPQMRAHLQKPFDTSQMLALL